MTTLGIVATAVVTFWVIMIALMARGIGVNERHTIDPDEDIVPQEK